MRRIVLSSTLLPIFAVTALAASPQQLACRHYATGMADEWAAGYLDRADEGTSAGPGEVLIIAAGRKYYVPAAGGGIVDPVYKRMRLRNKVYFDEYHRCLKGGDITINLGTANIAQ